jgi:hypothetical protein
LPNAFHAYKLEYGKRGPGFAPGGEDDGPAGDPGRTGTLNLQPGALSLHLYGRDVLAYDRAGRLWSATLGELTYRRGLDNRIQAIWMTTEGLRRRWLSR